jgi:hypothetical protein
MPHRSDYDPYADREDDYDPFAEFRNDGMRPRRPDLDALYFRERARLYGTPAGPNGGYWMDREAEAAGVPAHIYRSPDYRSRALQEASPGGRSGNAMTVREAVERLSGGKLETMPTPGRRVQTRCERRVGGRTFAPAEYTWIRPDPARPILAPGEHERAFAVIMRACSSGIAELRYCHPDDPLQSRRADFEGLCLENLDPFRSELVVGDARYSARVLLLDRAADTASAPPPICAASEKVMPGSSAKAQAPEHTRPPTRRKPGPRASVKPRVEAAMRADLQQGKVTLAELRDMKQIEMQTRYGASADTCRNARSAVLSG